MIPLRLPGGGELPPKMASEVAIPTLLTIGRKTIRLQAAEQINQQLQTAAPGSASILEAQTSAWLVRANAYTQSAMAELVRVRSIELANSGAQVKFSAAHTSTLYNAGGLLLQAH